MCKHHTSMILLPGKIGDNFPFIIILNRYYIIIIRQEKYELVSLTISRFVSLLSCRCRQEIHAQKR